MLGYATGAIHPIQGCWYLEKPLELKFPNGKWMVVIRDSHFHVFVEEPEPPDLAGFKNEIMAVVQGSLDALSFHMATSLRAEIVSLVLDGNRLVYFTSSWPEVLPNGPVTSVAAAQLEPFTMAAAQEPLVRFALADLRAAIEQPDDTAFLSYRAVESVRQWFLAETEEDTDKARQRSWSALREALKVERETLGRLAILATARRHGGARSPTAAERLEAMQIAREVVAKFVAHVHQAIRP